MRKATKKPVEINWNTYEEVIEKFPVIAKRETIYINGYKITIRGILTGPKSFIVKSLGVETLEGEMSMSKEDVLIVGVEGEIYPCKINIFKKTYNFPSKL